MPLFVRPSHGADDIIRPAHNTMAVNRLDASKNSRVTFGNVETIVYDQVSPITRDCSSEPQHTILVETIQPLEETIHESNKRRDCRWGSNKGADCEIPPVALQCKDRWSSTTTTAGAANKATISAPLRLPRRSANE